MGSVIIVVEDDSEQSIGQHSKKDDDRQDPSLWRRKVHSLTDPNMTCHGKWVKSLPVIWRLCWKIFFQHLAPATSRLSSSFTLLLSMVPTLSLLSALLKTWQGWIYFVVIIKHQRCTYDHLKCTNHRIKDGLGTPPKKRRDFLGIFPKCRTPPLPPSFWEPLFPKGKMWLILRFRSFEAFLVCTKNQLFGHYSDIYFWE